MSRRLVKLGLSGTLVLGIAATVALVNTKSLVKERDLECFANPEYTVLPKVIDSSRELFGHEVTRKRTIFGYLTKDTKGKLHYVVSGPITGDVVSSNLMVVNDTRSKARTFYGYYRDPEYLEDGKKNVCEYYLRMSN